MLMRSVSGMRGIVGQDLTPELVVRHAAAFGAVVKGKRIVVASDTRPTGPMIKDAAISGLCAVGCDVVDIGIAPTPTVPLAVTRFRAAAGLAITASHNAIEWNALKFLGSSKTVLSPRMLERIYRTADRDQLPYKDWKGLGTVTRVDDAVEMHVNAVTRLKAVDRTAIASSRPVVVYDAGGGAGAAYGPALLRSLGCRVHELYCEPGPRFPRGPEPTPKNLRALGAAVRKHKADIGFATDPDADRLAIVDENGRPLGEERTLILATYWVLSKSPGPVVINLSTSRAVMDVASAFGQKGYTAKVGEINVAEMIKAKRAVIGGEGNGGVIMPVLHQGRDALLGMALVLSLWSNTNASISSIAAGLPTYYSAKTTVPRPRNLAKRLERLARRYADEHQDDRDGIKVDLADGSIHARPSNTEPIMRISAEARTAARARALLAEGIKALGL